MYVDIEKNIKIKERSNEKINSIHVFLSHFVKLKKIRLNVNQGFICIVYK
jgi:hypothetical protein